MTSDRRWPELLMLVFEDAVANLDEDEKEKDVVITDTLGGRDSVTGARDAPECFYSSSVSSLGSSASLHSLDYLSEVLGIARVDVTKFVLDPL
jgi:hypothetical protein